MVELNDLYDLAIKNCITVDCFDMNEVKSFSCMTAIGNCYIAIDPLKLDNSNDEIERLAHELGHCLTGSFFNMNNMLDVRDRHEYRADRWAVEHAILGKK